MAGRKKMNLPDISALSLSELKALEKKVAKAIVTHEARERKAALQTLESTARDLGYSLSDLTGMQKAPRRGGTVQGVAKFRNPANAAQTWTGKGRRPEWIKAALAEGRSMEDLAI